MAATKSVCRLSCIFGLLVADFSPMYTCRLCYSLSLSLINIFRVSMMILSLWLLLPAEVQHRLSAEISELAKPHGAPSFTPHITIVGGISTTQYKNAEEFLRGSELIPQLRQRLQGFGTVPIQPEVEKPVRGHQEVWYQALYYALQPNDDFVRLCRLCRQVLIENQFLEPSSLAVEFPPPASTPHISMYYGVDNVPPHIVTLSPR